MDELAKQEEMGDLYAYYGKLLTAVQQDYFEDYYYADLSLGEIAANHHVSRQAVFENLKRSSKSLLHYEKVLHCRSEEQKISILASSAAQKLAAGDLHAAKNKLQTLISKLK